MNHTSRAAAIQVGIAGLLALLAMILGVVWLKEYRLGQKKTDYFSRFEEVGSLAEGDPVAVRGVKKGAVTAWSSSCSGTWRCTPTWSCA